MGEIVRVDPYTVPADQTGPEGQEVPLGASRLQHGFGVDPHLVEDDCQLVDQRDVEVALRVFDNLCCLGHTDAFGLVGGHCIGVDPYYLTHKAEAVGYHPQVILAGRRINDGMGAYVAGQLVKAMLKRRIQVEGSRVLVMGLTFKENCPDLRNTRVVDVVRELQDYGVQVDVHDPSADTEAARLEYGLDMVQIPAHGNYDGIVLAVAHDHFTKKNAASIRDFGKANHVLYDLKNVFAAHESDLRL